MCVETCLHVRAGMCVDMCIERYIDMWCLDVYIDMYTGMRIDMCRDMHVDLCIDMRDVKKGALMCVQACL